MEETSCSATVPPQMKKTSRHKDVLLFLSSWNALCRSSQARSAVGKLGVGSLPRPRMEGATVSIPATSSTSFPHRHRQIARPTVFTCGVQDKTTKNPINESVHYTGLQSDCNGALGADGAIDWTLVTLSSSTSIGSQRRVGASCCFRPSELFEVGR